MSYDFFTSIRQLGNVIITIRHYHKNVPTSSFTVIAFSSPEDTTVISKSATFPPTNRENLNIN